MSLSWLVYHCFSTSWALGFAEFVVDFVHNLHFQVKREKCECHAVAHHSLNTQASGTNNIEVNHWTFTCPDEDSSQIPERRLHKTALRHHWSIAPKKREWEGLKASLIIEAVNDYFAKYYYRNTGCSHPFSPDKRCCSLTCIAKLASNCPEIAHLIIQPNRKFEHNLTNQQNVKNNTAPLHY